MEATQTGHRQTPPRAGPDAGFTLAELLFAIGITVVVMVAVLGALAAATSSSLLSSRRATALTIANDQLEWARNMDYDSVGVPGGEPPGVIPAVRTAEGYSVATSITWSPDTRNPLYPAYKIMRVTVSWGSAQPVSVISSIYGKRKTGPGHVQFTLLDVVSGAPLSQAVVSIVASTGATYNRTTGADGVCTAYDVPSGYAQVTITKTGYLFDTDTFSIIYVTPGQWNTFTRYGQSPGTTRSITVRRPDGTFLASTPLTLEGPGPNPTQSTNASGTATFTNLLIGTYAIQATGWVIEPALIITSADYTQVLTHEATATVPPQ